MTASDAPNNPFITSMSTVIKMTSQYIAFNVTSNTIVVTMTQFMNESEMCKNIFIHEF